MCSSVTTTSFVTLTANDTQLLVDGLPVYTGALPPSDTSNWANYPAVANVNMSGKAIISPTTDLSLVCGGSIILSSTSNIKVQTKMETKGIEMTGLVSQSFAGGGCNFFQSAVQIGTNGILPTDKFGSEAIYGVNLPAGFSSLYVSGGTTLDGGGTIHGITIGTQPVAGINTVRIDVLPVGMLLTSPTFITMNGLGAANIAMGGAIAIGAGSYVTLEHGAGLGANGIFVQNTARDSNAKMIFTGGGTLYNATEVQASNIVNPLGVRFYNGVYNPSGGSIIVPAVYGRAVVDLSTSSSYFATLTGGDLPATKNTNSVFLGNLTNLTTGGVSNTIAIGNLSGMTGQGDNSVAIGNTAGQSNQGTGCVAVGQAGATSQGSNSVAIGLFAGNNTQGASAVAIGDNAGQVLQGSNAIAIGVNSGYTSQGVSSIAIGDATGFTSIGDYSIAMGKNCDVVESNAIILNATGSTLNATTSGSVFVAPMRNVDGSGFQVLARNAGTGEIIQTLIDASTGFIPSSWSLYPAVSAVNVSGFNLTNVSQGTFNKLILNSTTIALGLSAGVGQGGNAIAIGASAGGVSQISKAVAIGFEAGYSNQASNCVAIGNTAGFNGQLADAVAIGAFAGNSNQNLRAVAIGSGAGAQRQGIDSIAIGTACANVSQGSNAIAMGNSAGQSNQGVNAIAIGQNAGSNLQGTQSVAVGNFAGYASQVSNATAVGYVAGFASQGGRSTAIGSEAGAFNLGSNSVAVGYAAAYTGGSFSNVVVVNATGAVLNPAQANSCYIAPMRSLPTSNAYQSHLAFYNDTTKEVLYEPSAYTAQVVATSATPIVLLSSARGKTYILTGTTTQTFVTSVLTANDVGFFVNIRNGNAVGVANITIAGATGNTTLFSPTLTQNTGAIMLYWNGTGLVGY
jgi:hypothetical protein